MRTGPCTTGPFSRVAVRLATSLLPPGSVHRRWQAELDSELAELQPSQRLAAGLSMIAAAPALHRSLVETGVLSCRHSPLWCRVRLHHRWRTRSTDDGSRYRRCAHCGIDYDGTMKPADFGGYAVNMHGIGW